ncbi:CoA-binding protein [Fodinibius halophilus]|uniref:CoA-binding protein n=1 Tax=Fodinibius halophilus TaxID=1736908 RepID=A0A6M1THF7_9BACT|nr:CoA-binding protein [Fodinibius halophilus]NGP88070.1 CoA-binding protein [Fodinibius halophilus]
MNLDIKKELENINTVVILGCSANKYRTSYHIANYLKENGIDIIPVNPNYDEIMGQKCYDSMEEVPSDKAVDVVDIFRDSEYTAEMVQDVIDWSQQSGQKPLIWTQLSVSSPEAKLLAENAGLKYVENECIMVQHGKLVA